MYATAPPSDPEPFRLLNLQEAFLQGSLSLCLEEKPPRSFGPYGAKRREDNDEKNSDPKENSNKTQKTTLTYPIAPS